MIKELNNDPRSKQALESLNAIANKNKWSKEEYQNAKTLIGLALINSNSELMEALSNKVWNTLHA